MNVDTMMKKIWVNHLVSELQNYLNKECSLLIGYSKQLPLKTLKKQNKTKQKPQLV